MPKKSYVFVFAREKIAKNMLQSIHHLPVAVFCTGDNFGAFSFLKGCLEPFRVGKRKLQKKKNTY